MTAEPQPGLSALEEEPWEAEIGTLLGGLPAVDPPDGFIDAAIDHRPLHAGRVLVGLVAATLALVGLTLASGVVERAGIVPPIDELVAQHDLAAQARVPGGGEAGPAESGAEDDAENDVEDEAEDRSLAGSVGDRPLDLPDGFEAASSATIEDVRQALYARGDETVSVFVQEGRVDWGAMPADRLTDLGGLPAWVDAERSVAVIEADGAILTVIGLSPGELTTTIEGAVDEEISLRERASELAEAVVTQFGYAPVG